MSKIKILDWGRITPRREGKISGIPPYHKSETTHGEGRLGRAHVKQLSRTLSRSKRTNRGTARGEPKRGFEVDSHAAKKQLRKGGQTLRKVWNISNFIFDVKGREQESRWSQSGNRGGQKKSYSEVTVECTPCGLGWGGRQDK